MNTKNNIVAFPSVTPDMRRIADLKKECKAHSDEAKLHLVYLSEIAEQDTEIIYKALFHLYVAISHIKGRKEDEQKLADLEALQHG